MSSFAENDTNFEVLPDQSAESLSSERGDILEHFKIARLLYIDLNYSWRKRAYSIFFANKVLKISENNNGPIYDREIINHYFTYPADGEDRLITEVCPEQETTFSFKHAASNGGLDVRVGCIARILMKAEI